MMVEGESGLLAVAGEAIEDWVPSRHLLRFKSGAEAALFSGASPEKLRGPQHHFAWCDELAKWRHPRATWDMLQFGLRLGERPRALITTTPQSGRALEELLKLPGTVESGGATRDNIYLSKAFLDSVHTLYRGTRLEAQELEGQLLPASNFALWSPELIERCRIEDVAPAQAGACPSSRCPTPAEAPACAGVTGTFTKIVIGVDPPSGDGTCGIVACGRDASGTGYVLGDHSVSARGPKGWARAVSDAVRVHEAQSALPVSVIAERNQGGKMVEAVLLAADPSLKVTLVNASEGKVARAAPVSMAFEAGRVKLAGRFPKLEAELRGFRSGSGYDPGGWIGPGNAAASPDRADAMVWALTALVLNRPVAEPRVRRL